MTDFLLPVLALVQLAAIGLILKFAPKAGGCTNVEFKGKPVGSEKLARTAALLSAAAIVFVSSPVLAKPMTAQEEADYKACTAKVDLFSLWKCIPESKEPRPSDPEPQNDYDRIAREVARDEAQKYSIVAYSENPDPVERCVQAGIVAQAYLQAKAAISYETWKRTEQRDCQRVRR